MTHKELVAELLSSQSTLALATTSPPHTTAAEHSSPHVAPLFYLATEALSLYWLSSASSLHSRNLKQNPSAAVAIYAPAQHWKQIRGVQMRGAVVLISGASSRAPILAAYCKRFELGAPFQDRIARSRLYCFQPQWIRYLDNSKRLGYKFEMTVDGAFTKEPV